MKPPRPSGGGQDLRKPKSSQGSAGPGSGAESMGPTGTRNGGDRGDSGKAMTNSDSEYKQR